MPMRRWLAAGVMMVIFGFSGCSRDGGDDVSQSAEERFAHLARVDFTVKDIIVRAWVARSDNDVTSGLMHVQADDMTAYSDGAEKGMFFYFDRDRSTNEGFWMRNVPIPLDIAFLKADGTVVTVETMAAFDLRSTYAAAPYRYTLEVSGGLLHRLNLSPGDVISIPDSILNSEP